MKKFLITLTLIFASCLTTFNLTACSNGCNGNNGGENPPPHTHNYQTVKFDNECHWNECSCGEKNDVIEHLLNNGICTCGYEKSETHNTHEYSSEYSFDNDNHWFECSCGEKKDKTLHVLNDGICVCGYEESETHTHEYKTVKFDSENHWHECSCGDKKDIENHKEGSAKCNQLAECSICGTEYGDYQEHNYNDSQCIWCFEEKASVGLEYSLSYEEDEYYITGLGTCEDENIIIPKTYKNKPVTAINDLNNNSQIKTIEIPENITWLAGQSFEYCSELKEIKITHANIRIDDGFLEGCYNLQSITCPNELNIEWFKGVYMHHERPRDYEIMQRHKQLKSVTIILNSVPYISGFAGWESITHVEIIVSEELKQDLIENEYGLEVANSAFGDCKGLKNIILPEQVQMIGSSAFSGCIALESINLPKQVQTIGSGAFSWCVALENIKIPEQVQMILGGAFHHCYSLTSITIPASTTYIEGNVFAYCDSLKEIKVEDDNPIYTTYDGNLYSKDVDRGGLYELITCLNGKPQSDNIDYHVPDDISLFGTEAFLGCYKLNHIIVPQSITSLDFIIQFREEEINVNGNIHHLNVQIFVENSMEAFGVTVQTIEMILQELPGIEAIEFMDKIS